MKWLIVLALLFAQERPYLAVVPARDTVMPGQVFAVTITAFNITEPIQFDPGGLEVITDTFSLPTRHLWLRAAGPPRDVRVRAWGAGVEAGAVIRICCARAPDAVGTRRMFLPAFRA